MGDLSAYVSREALIKSLQNLTGKSDVRLLDDYKVEKATSGLEGFTSLVLRVNLNYSIPGDEDIKHHTLFVKSMSPMDYQREISKDSKVFLKESLYFTKAMPVMNKVSAGRVPLPLAACFYAIDDSDKAAFYMEDLVYSGYRSADRSQLFDGLDLPHCTLVMKALGRLHAISLAAEKTLDSGKGSWIKSYPDFDRDYFYYVAGPGERPPVLHKTIESSIENIKELCREIEGLPQEAAASGALDKVLEGAWPTICRLKTTPTGKCRVLTHGDCWMNNMMFRYKKKTEEDEEEPVDVKLYDLQMAKVCHPGIDLLYFLYINTRRRFRENYFTSLIDLYYESLTVSLMFLDGSSPPFSLSELKTDLLGYYKTFGVLVATFFSPMMLLGDQLMLPNSDDMTPEKMEELYNTGSAPIIAYRFRNDEKYRSKVEDIFREFVEVALPNGVQSVNSSPLLCQKSVEK
ncbi:uncharacterized protein LOC124168249 [Ischnura elegans]|uniref:uncharacterized protein LOC124168249 n=1 Tax=Ischnura elegans TaxID=197161 RepID=UPI001ED8A17E|nr:uncharacterized protein LOC124168249 [Ischnura elegans]